MPALNCYRIRPHLSDAADGDGDFADVLADDPPPFERTEIVRRNDFSATAYTVRSSSAEAPWLPFLRYGFTGLDLGASSAPSALLVVQARPARADQQHSTFAFAFGPRGRHLLRGDAYERGYGLRVALNLIYPRDAPGASRLRAVDSKRRGATTVRSRYQSSELADFETFDVNRLRDVVSKANGRPADSGSWGKRVGGGDALTLNLEIAFDHLGDLCRAIEGAHRRDDYQDRFSWIDDVQPIADPDLADELEAIVVSQLRGKQTQDLSLAPPEVIDWDEVAAFRYHFDPRRRATVTRPDIRLVDYLNGLGAEQLEELDALTLRSRYVYALDGDDAEKHHWSVWRCLVGEVAHDGDTYILDEGEFFRVSNGYLEGLDAAIKRIPSSDLALPPTTPTKWEDAYNRDAAAASTELLLLDKRTVTISSRTTPVEICDLLSTKRQLIHVKRHLGSSDLSHLFSQGLVSAELLQSSPEFRDATRAKIAEVADGRDGFDFFSGDTIRTSEFEVAYAIAERWNGRSLVEALPFFSKVNLRDVAERLRGRGFKVTLNQIHADGLRRRRSRRTRGQTSAVQRAATR